MTTTWCWAILEVPDDLPRATRQRLLRVVPTLEALLATARDRENVNNRLIESRQRLEQFFDLTSDLMVISDQGKLLQVNPAFEEPWATRWTIWRPPHSN